MKIKFFIILFSSLFFFGVFSSCSSEFSEEELNLTSEEVNFRINLIYEHTIMMGELSSKEVLEKINLDVSNLKRNNLISYEKKLDLLDEAFGVSTKNEIKVIRVLKLEKIMTQMMEKWEFEN